MSVIKHGFWFLIPIVMLTGCAAGYHCYPCGTVSFQYRPPNPLPYSSAETSTCNDSKGQNYLSNVPTEIELENRTNLTKIPADSNYYGTLPRK